MNPQISSIDCAILAFAQLIQPARPEEIFEVARGNVQMDQPDEPSFFVHFNRLERAGFLWRTEDQKFVTTPGAYPLIKRALKPRDRDKLRLLLLNKQTYDLDRMHRQ